MQTDSRTAGAPPGSAPTGGSMMTTREHDLIVALKKLCDATQASLNTNGVESIGVCYARRSAMRLMAQYEHSPNDELKNAGH
jgi:hypothetical protein